jgi:periodic tryptophan protein 1
VFSASFSPDDPLTLAAAGSAAKLQIWDVGASQHVRHVFGVKLREAGKVIRERDNANGGVVGVVSDGEDSEEE